MKLKAQKRQIRLLGVSPKSPERLKVWRTVPSAPGEGVQIRAFRTFLGARGALGTTRPTPEPLGNRHRHCKEGLPVTNLEAGCENKCASPYIGVRFGENSVGGMWLIGAGLRISLTLSEHGKGAVGG